MSNEKKDDILEDFDNEIYIRTSNNNMPIPTGQFLKLSEEEMKEVEEVFKLAL
ncbi:hypothetical protein [Paenibacillus elgii]|uniref:hypothetical protein n=1 Tax=Paenibacillus elgii TaxID=189691 RepID=UPI000A607275|nr:hypothetical protein [Paenibacillus elgii]MCM3268662.1 hypothetical protein [Paenibacillus elgii]